MSFESTGSLQVAGLFAGIGGIEVGLARAGHRAALLCEIDSAAQHVLKSRIPNVPLVGDIRDVRSLPGEVDLVAAGFPCTDISQAGRTAGIFGAASGLVDEVFRLIRRRYPDWLLIENVPNMLVLRRGEAISHVIGELERMKMRWAYRVVDSRSVGVPQRRRRVLLLASRRHDPREVLFADDAGEPDDDAFEDSAYGFYWTEGLRGLGWARDAVPTLKGGSTIGIASPPAIWVPGAGPGRRLVVPTVCDAEALQGFDRGWTSAFSGQRSSGSRMKMVGNAVTVGVAAWIGSRLDRPGTPLSDEASPLGLDSSWPTAAWGESGRRFAVRLSEYPTRAAYAHLREVVDLAGAPALSHRGAAGFLGRTRRAKLRFDPAFLADVEEHVLVTDPERDLATAS